MPLGVDNLIEKSWAVFEKFQRRNGVSVDEASFVGGFLSMYGIITGRVNVGLGPDGEQLPLAVILDRIQRDAEEIRTKVIQAAELTQTLGMKKGH